MVSGKVPLTLQQRRHGRKLIERILSVLAIEVDEIKSLAATAIDVRNIQRPADRAAKTILQICWLFFGLAGERIR